MVLIPWEIFKAMQGVDTKIQNKPADVELKLRRQKMLRKCNIPKNQLDNLVNLPHSLFSINKRKKANALIKHMDKNKDRIRYDSGELQFDGIKAGDSNIKDLALAVVNDA